MNCEIKFKKKRIILGIIFFSIFLSLSIWFIVNPKIFIRNFLMTESHIILLGLIGVITYIPFLFSFITILPRKVALTITDNYLIDRSKYESLGKISWGDVAKIKRIKKRSLRITFKKPIFENKKMFFVKRFLLFMQNWDYKDSIIISTALLECDIDYLEDKILEAYKNYKKHNRHNKINIKNISEK